MPLFQIGDLISFSYHGQYTHDQYPQILVLHTKWVRKDFPKETPKVHGLNWNNLSDDEINYIKAVLNPTFAKEISKTNFQLRQRLSSVGAMSAVSGVNIQSPNDFYIRFVKPFIRQHDSYRLYKQENMSGIKIITKRDILIGKEKGMFSNYANKFKNIFRER